MQFFNKFGQAIDSIRGYFSRGNFNINVYSWAGQTGEVYIDTQKPRFIYDSIPQLRTVIEKDATMFSNAVIKIVDERTGAEVEDKELRKLLDQPNVLQSMNEWLKNYSIQLNIYGNQFIYMNKTSPLLKYPASLINISPKYIQPVLTGKVFDQLDLVDIISKYHYQDGQRQKFYETQDIIYSKITDIDNPVIGCSPLISLKHPLSNIDGAYKYMNTVSSRKGAIGFVSNNSKDSLGSIPLKPKEQKRIENAYTDQYGTDEGKSAVVVTKSNLAWTPTSYPLAQMQLLEQNDSNFLTIVDHFGHNINIYSSKSATFENVRAALVQVYQDRIIPNADSFAQMLTKALGLVGKRIELSYDHLPIMKESKLKGMAAFQNMVNTVISLLGAGLISDDQADSMIANELGVQVAVGGNKTLRILSKLSPLVANNVLSNMTIDEVRNLVTLGVWDGKTPLNSSPIVTPTTAA